MRQRDHQEFMVFLAVYAHRDALRVHAIKKHAWCIDTNAPVTQETLNVLKLKMQ